MQLKELDTTADWLLADRVSVGLYIRRINGELRDGRQGFYRRPSLTFFWIFVFKYVLNLGQTLASY